MNAIWTDSPVGPLTIWESDGAVVKLAWGKSSQGEANEVLNQAVGELASYFAGELTEFETPWNGGGNEFQKTFLQALFDIPFGETRTYGDLAQELGVSAQSIGQACGANPIPIIVPCHRVLGADGLGGFSGGTGIETKVALLKHEGAASLLI